MNDVLSASAAASSQRALVGDAVKGSLESLDNVDFLRRCRAGIATKTELTEFLVQHYFYSRHFTRYLCALIANLTNDADRVALTGNLWEEMGLGPQAGTPHSQIYREMLVELDIDPSRYRPSPKTLALVDTMFRLTSDPESIVGLGAIWLGAEALVPRLYRQILAGLLGAGFPEKHLLFFQIHIDGDDEHAATMERIARRLINEDADRYHELVYAATLAIERRRQFFLGLNVPVACH